jgi:hypothetical protein
MSSSTATALQATSSSDDFWLLGSILGNHTEPVLLTQRTSDGTR